MTKKTLLVIVVLVAVGCSTFTGTFCPSENELSPAIKVLNRVTERLNEMGYVLDSLHDLFEVYGNGELAAWVEARQQDKDEAVRLLVTTRAAVDIILAMCPDYDSLEGVTSDIGPPLGRFYKQIKYKGEYYTVSHP